MAIWHCYWHLVVKNDNFTLLLTSIGQEWQLADLLLDLLVDLPPKCIMGYILWDVFGSHFEFFKKRWQISFYFWIIRLVNSQLALYSHVRCNPPWHPQNTPKWQLQISTMRAYICQVWYVILLLKLILADGPPPVIEHRCLQYWYTKLGRWTYFGRWTPWIIEHRCLDSQLAFYSHVRYNSLDTLKHPQNNPQMTITNFNYEGWYLPGVICNIVVKADLGRSASRSTPTPKCIMGYIL